MASSSALAAVEQSEIDDLNIIHSVCSSYWDDIAEEYVDEAGRCMEAIVSASPPTLSLHEVTVDTVGVVGIQVNRQKCQDQTRDLASPGPPREVRLVVAYLRDGQVFATTPLSQPLKSAANGGNNDERSIVSDLSSLGASLLGDQSTSQENGSASGLVVEPIPQQVVGTWRSSETSVTFDSCLEVSANGETASDIDVVLYLVNGGRPNEETLASVPLAIGGLRIEGNGYEKGMTCDIPLHEPFEGKVYPNLYLRNPHFVAKLQEDDDTLFREPQHFQPTTASGKNTKRKKRGFAKLFSARKKIDDEELEAPEEEKKEEEEEHDSLVTPCSAPTPFINNAYFLDQVQGAFLRFKAEWKEKEINFEVNLQGPVASTTGQPLAKVNSIRDVKTSEENNTLEQESESLVQDAKESHQAPDPEIKLTNTGKAVSDIGPGTKQLPVVPEQTIKKTKTKSFFFKRKINESRGVVTLPEPPLPVINKIQKGLGKEEETDPLTPEPGQEVRKAAMLQEIQTSSRRIGENEQDELEHVDHARNAEIIQTKHATGTDDDTAHSIFDSVLKAIVGNGSASIEGKTENEAKSITDQSQKSLGSQKSPQSEKKYGEYVPTGTAFCHVLPAEQPGDSIENESRICLEKAVSSQKQETRDEENELHTEAGIELTPDSYLYAQIVQATSSLFVGNESSTNIESNENEKVSPPEHKPERASMSSETRETVDMPNASSPKQTLLQEGPVDSVAMDAELSSEKDRDEFSPPKLNRILTPSPAEQSMERILSWDGRQAMDERKGPRFGFGRRRRGVTGSGSTKIAPSHNLKNKNSTIVPLASKKEASVGNSNIVGPKHSSIRVSGLNDTEPFARKIPLKPPGSLVRHPRDVDKLDAEKKTDCLSAVPQFPAKYIMDTGEKHTKRRNLWGKLFRSKSTSSLQINSFDESASVGIAERCNASVVSDAETVEIDNMAKASVLEALREGTDRAKSPATVQSKAEQSATSEATNEANEPVKNTGFSFLQMFSNVDSGAGPVKVDDKDVWLYARDDETYVTKESNATNKRWANNEDELTLIPSPTDVLLSETYHRCGPGKIADLGDAILEETRQLISHSGVRCFQDKSDGETFASFTFDEPTYDPSILSGDAKSASFGSKGKSIRSMKSTPSRNENRLQPGTPNIASAPQTDNDSPKGVADFDRGFETSKVESFSEAFMNFITCRVSARDTVDSRTETKVPAEFIRHNDTDSVDDLTLTTYEMQVEIEQYRKKIEEARQEAENLDENGEEVSEDAALVFQPPSVNHRNERSNDVA